MNIKLSLVMQSVLSKIIIKYIKLKNIKRIRLKLKNIKNINDVIFIFKYLSDNKIRITTDDLFNLIYTCYLFEPPTDSELQIISMLQQKHINTHNIEEYSITTLWVCILYYIDNLPKIKRQKTWP